MVELLHSSALYVNLFLIFLFKHWCEVPMASDIRAIRERTSYVVDSCFIYYVTRDNAIYDFSKKAVENGLDIFRVFDSLNYFGAYFKLETLSTQI